MGDFQTMCHTQSFLKPLERENKFFLSSQVSLLVLKNEILCIQFFLSPHGVSLLLLSKLHKSFKVGKCRSRVLFLCTSFYQMLYSQLLSQLDLQENGSYTVFVCPSASTVFLLLCCVCKLHQEEAEKWQQQLLQKVSSIK